MSAISKGLRKLSKTRAWLAATLFAVALPMAGVWTGLWVFFAHDLRHHTLPWRAWAARTWVSGEIPMWSSQVGLGFPLFADGQTGVMYPPNILLGLILDPWHALSFSLALHTLWAALGMWVLARSVGRSLPAASLAALAFALGGFLVGHLSYAGMQHVASSFPWLIWAALRLHRPTWARALGFGGLVALVLTAGHPQAAVISLMGAAIAFWSRRLPSPKAAGMATVGAGVGVLAALPQLLASAELAQHSARAGGVDLEFAGMGSLPPWELINLMLPRFWGWEPPSSIPVSYMHKGAQYFGTGETHWEGMLYVGVPVLALGLLGLRRKENRLWVGLLVAGAIFAVGRYTPIYGLVHRLPGLSFFRFPARYGLWMALALPMLAAWAVDRFPKLVAAKWLWAAAALLILGGVGALAALPLVEPIIAPKLLGAVGPERTDILLAGMRWNGSWGLLLPVGALLSAGAVLALDRVRWLPLLLAVELILGLWGYNSLTSSGEAMQTPETVAALPEGLDRVGIVDRVQPTQLDQELMSASMATLYGANEVIVLSPLRMPGHEELLSAAGLDVGMDHGPNKAEDAQSGKYLVDLLGVRRIFTVHRLGQPYVPVMQTRAGVRVYDNPEAFPRAWFVDCAAGAPLVALDLRHQVQLEALEEREVEGACLGSEAAVEVEQLTDGHFRVAVDAPASGWLVLSQTQYPGWSASLGEQRVIPGRANQVMQAWAISPGEQSWEVRYSPPWRWSLWISLGAWLILAVHFVSTAIREGMQRAA